MYKGSNNQDLEIFEDPEDFAGLLNNVAVHKG